MILDTLYLALAVSGFATFSNAFSAVHLSREVSFSSSLRGISSDDDVPESSKSIMSALPSTRKAFIASMVTSTIGLSSLSVNAEDEDGFESIAARAAKISKIVDAQEEEEKSSTTTRPQVIDTRTVYDFSIPVAGDDIPFKDLVRQEFTTVEIPGENEGEVIKQTETKVKAILVVNIKQDDPIARQNIPELISLASKFGRNGEFVVVCSPTEQGYFEPDTSALIRLKLASEYGYGINPTTIITDKMNFLGTGAHPFWRYLESTCRAPSGLGRIQGNFEKFLVDGRTGKAIRRYPRKYQPFDIAADIDAIMKGKPLPPAGANWREEWRISDKEAERDTYRFQKGLNVFDQ